MKKQKLSPDELKALRAFLYTWQHPAVVLAQVDEIDSAIYFNQAGLAFLQDAWIGATFALASGRNKIRLINDEWPDFEVQADDEHASRLRCEAVEAMEPGRRRGQEYKDQDAVLRHRDVENWRAATEAIPEIVRNSVRKKIQKSYATECDLVIYLNVSTYGLMHEAHVAKLGEYVDLTGSRFRTAWVLWHDRAFLIWET